MALDNKQSGEKLFAFELNNLAKQIRQLTQNIIDISNSEDVIVASDELRASADTERTYRGATYNKVKEIMIKRNGVARIKFSLRCYNSGYPAYGRIYKNGIAFGTERSANSTGYYTEFSEDLAVNKNDLLQIYIKATYHASYGQAYVSNFRIYYSDATPIITVPTIILD